MPTRRAQRLREVFARSFGRACTVVARAPGRVNLIGEHTDYNDGFVLPIALAQCTWVAAAPRTDGCINVLSLDLSSRQSWPLAGWTPDRYPDWTAYLAGVATLLRRRGVPLRGCDLLIRSDVPVGAGLSSSAALEVAVALALGATAHAPLGGTELADLCRAAEHEFARVPCGIMDQYVSVLARAGCALLLDCRSRKWEHIPLSLGPHVVLVADSGVRHQLAAGEYALRQQQCRQAVEFLERAFPAAQSLRDVTVEMAQAQAPHMPTVVARRALHVTSENQRTLAAAAALRRSDLAEFGRLMRASHESLRNHYEVSCPELDLLVDLVSSVPGVLGARMTGGGFGGCIVVLTHCAAQSEIEAVLEEKYNAAGYGPASLLLTRPGRGASVEHLSGA